ncbi:MAG: hypothetical protein IT562_24495 [Alphaproteobacteria bacterium]|nr:hypothetical protein [Alphaproteobacteria bacterium]
MKQASSPDIADLLARKAAGRRKTASRSFGEKIEMLNDLRRRANELRKARLTKPQRKNIAPGV